MFIALYFITTSNLFLSKIVVPSVGRYILKTDYSVEHVKYNPFTSYFELNDVLVGDKKHPFIKAKKAYCYINIFPLFHKVMEFKFREIYIEDIDVNFIKKDKKNWSIPWLYVNVPPKEKIKFAVDFTDITISNMNIKYQQDIDYGDCPLEAEMNNLNVRLKYLKNGLLSPIKYNGKIKIKSSKTGVVNSGHVTGLTQVNLSEWCIPSHVNISSLITDISTGTKYPKIANRKITFDLDLRRKSNDPTVNDLNYLRIRDISSSKTKSELNAKGKLNFYPFDFSANINANPIHAPTLRIFNNLLGNYDLGDAVFSYQSNLSVSPKFFNSAGKLSITQAIPTISNFQFTKGIPLDLSLDYSVNWDHVKDSVVLKKLFSTLSKDQEELVKVTLNEPMPFNCRKDQIAYSKIPPTISIRTSDMNLKHLNKIITNKIQILSGKLNSDIILSLDPHNNNNINITGVTKANNTQIEIRQSKKLLNLNFDQTIDIKIENFKNIKINKCELSINKGSQKGSKVIISGNYDIDTKKGKIHTLIPYINKNIVEIYCNIPDSNKKICSLINETSPFYIYLDNELLLDFNKDNMLNVEKLKLVFSNPKKSSSITLTLLDHFAFKVNQKYDIILLDDIIFKSDVKNLDFPKIVNVLPASFPLKFRKGNFTYKLLLIIPKELNAIKIKGQIALLYASLSFYNQYIRDLSVTSNINAIIYNTNAMDLTDTFTEVYINGVQCLKAETNGTLAFNNTDDSNLAISITDINKYFPDLFYDGISVNINKLNAKGKIICRFTNAGKKSFFKGNMNMYNAVFGHTDKKRHTIVNGDLNFDIIGTEKEFSINDLNISLRKEKKEVAQLNVSGNFPVPLKSDKANLRITSNHLELSELTPIYTNLSKEINKTFVSKTGEYEPIDFKGLDLDGDIKFNSISCGPLLNSNFHSKLNVKNNNLTLNQESSQLNGTDIKYHGELGTNHKHGYPFIFNAEFSNLDMEPFIKTFIPGNYKNACGTMNSFNLSLQGKGFSKKSIDENLTGTLDIKLSKLSIPYQIKQFNELKFLLAPIVILEQIREMLPGGFLVHNFEKGMKSTKNIMSNLDNINLKSGVIMLTAQKGKITLDKVSFLGEKDDTINYSDFYGTVYYNGNLDIYSSSNVSGIKMPFYIEGTIDKPIPNFTYFFIPKFLFMNILTLLNPVNVFSFAIDLCTGIYNTVLGGVCYVWNFIASPFTPADTKKIEKKKESMPELKGKNSNKNITYSLSAALLPAIDPVLQQT